MQSKIETITSGKSQQIYNQLLGNIAYTQPHKFAQKAYELYEKNYKNNPSINGRIFEYIICECLAQAKILPFYYQAQFERVPNADFDIVLYHIKEPVVLTIKTSLRERYKQADLEGLALKQVYRRSKIYLITLSEKEAPSTKKKIQEGDVAGLDDCILAAQPEFDVLLKKLKNQNFCKAEKILPIQKGKILE